MPRRENDAYFTPQDLTRELITRVPIIGKVYEPCAGNLAIVNAFPNPENFITNDIDPKMPTQFHVDATKDIPTDALMAKWVVTNPPFNRAIEVLRLHYWNFDNLALLVRLSFLEPTFARSEFLSEYPPSRMIVLPRCSFTNDGKTDSVTCAWLIWHRNSFRNSLSAYSTYRPIEICLKKKSQPSP